MSEEKYKFEPDKFYRGTKNDSSPHWSLGMPSDPDEAIAAIQFMQANYTDVEIITGESCGMGICEIIGKPKEEAP